MPWTLRFTSCNFVYLFFVGCSLPLLLNSSYYIKVRPYRGRQFSPDLTKKCKSGYILAERTSSAEQMTLVIYHDRDLDSFCQF